MIEDLTRHQEAFLLLQLLGADGGLSQGDANKALTQGGNRSLGLKEASRANKAREALIPRLIRVERRRTERGGTTNFYRITDDGIRHLLDSSQYPGPIQVAGLAIDRLIRHARSDRAEPSSAERAPRERLSNLILEIYRDLRRERHASTGLVPIHEIRNAVGEALGSESARHEVLDAELLELWRSERVRLLPINDGRRATPEQLAASITDGRVVWFYLEVGSS